MNILILGDVAGPAGVKAVKEKLPQNFQKSEYLLEKGMVDFVIHRKDLKKKIISILEFLNP